MSVQFWAHKWKLWGPGPQQWDSGQMSSRETREVARGWQSLELRLMDWWEANLWHQKVWTDPAAACGSASSLRVRVRPGLRDMRRHQTRPGMHWEDGGRKQSWWIRRTHFVLFLPIATLLLAGTDLSLKLISLCTLCAPKPILKVNRGPSKCLIVMNTFLVYSLSIETYFKKKHSTQIQMNCAIPSPPISSFGPSPSHLCFFAQQTPASVCYTGHRRQVIKVTRKYKERIRS